MPLFHKDIGFPPNFRAPDQRIDLTYTRHAREQCATRGIRELRCITLARFSVIEIEVSGNRMVKMVVRGRYDETNDICLVLRRVNNSWIVPTVWLNKSDDLHKTLDRTKYATV